MYKNLSMTLMDVLDQISDKEGYIRREEYPSAC